MWAAGHSTSLKSRIRKQKKAVRLISYTKCNAHTGPIFCKLKIFSVYDINKFQTCCFVYKSLNGLLPNIFNDIFVTNSDMHDHNTRQRTKLHVISHRIKIREFSIQIYDTKQWNSLEKSVIESPSFYIFKKRCKALILQQLNFNVWCICFNILSNCSNTLLLQLLPLQLL